MKTRLAENIRVLRKRQGLTQEQLAEVLGVTVGSVHKWETRMSTPELGMITEMADYFDVSVDVLLGYQMRDNRLKATVDRLWKASGTKDYDMLSEAEKAMQKYPNSFDVVWAGASLYYVFSTETKKEAWIRRAIELLERTLLLLPQCTDPRLNESILYGHIADMYAILGETDKALELLKNHNAGGQYDDAIGFTLVSECKKPEEAGIYMEKAFMRTVSLLIRSVLGYVLLLDARGDTVSGKEMIRWAVPILEGLKKTQEPCVLDRYNAVLLAGLAGFQMKSGEKEEAVRSLRQACALARAFDAAPNYEVNQVKFISRVEASHDSLGETTMDALEKALQYICPELLDCLKEVSGHDE